MKLSVYRLSDGAIIFQDGEISRFADRSLGVVDLPIEKPKKVVTKETRADLHQSSADDYLEVTGPLLPIHARNVRIVWEEEE